MQTTARSCTNDNCVSEVVLIAVITTAIISVEMYQSVQRSCLEEAKVTLVLSSLFVSCEEKDYYRVVSVGQLGFDCRSYCGHNHV